MTQFSTLKEALAIKVPEGKNHIEAWSSKDTGLGIRVNAKGTRSWIVRFTADKKNTKVNLQAPVDGKGSSFTAAVNEAKDKRARAQAQRTSTGSRTLAEAYASYREMRGTTLAPDSTSSFTKALAKVSPELARKPMGEITVEEWEHEYLLLSSGRGKATARSVLRLVNLLYRREKARDRVRANPISVMGTEIQLYRRGRTEKEPPEDGEEVPEDRARFILKADAPLIWQAMELLHPSVRDYLRMLLFTGFRKSLAGALCWNRLNIEKRTYLVKTWDKGAKGKRSSPSVDIHYPISDVLWDLVFAPRVALKKDGEVWILPSTKAVGRPIHEPRGSFDIIESKTGIRLSPHDFRKTCATIAESTLGSLVLVGAVLMHKSLQPLAGERPLTNQEKQSGDYVQTEAAIFRDAVNRLANGVLDYVGVAHS